MKYEDLNFNDLPEAVLHLIHEVAEIKHHLLQNAAHAGNITLPKQPEKEILTVDDVCKILGLKRGSVYNLTHRQGIPYYKRGQRIYFDRNEIDEWIRTDRRKTICKRELTMYRNWQIRMYEK